MSEPLYKMDPVYVRFYDYPAEPKTWKEWSTFMLAKSEVYAFYLEDMRYIDKSDLKDYLTWLETFMESNLTEVSNDLAKN